MLTCFVGRKGVGKVEGTCQTAKTSTEKLSPQREKETSEKFMSSTLVFLFNFFHFENIKKRTQGFGFPFYFRYEKDLPFNVRQETEDRGNVIQAGERNVFMV